MKNFHRFTLMTFLAAACSAGSISAESLRVCGSTTVNPVISDAAEILSDRQSLQIVIDTAGGSTGGINALGDGRADVAMSSREVADTDRTKFPAVDFRSHVIAQDSVSIVVSRDVFESGVHALTPDQIRGIFERSITNWSEVGGSDARIVFLSREPGRGEWEIFSKFLYPDNATIPRVNHPTVGANEETRTKTGSTRGAISFLSTPWADGESVFPLAIETADGERINASEANPSSRKYPMTRSLVLVTDGEPDGAARQLIDFILGPEGQEIVASHGYQRAVAAP